MKRVSIYPDKIIKASLYSILLHFIQAHKYNRYIYITGKIKPKTNKECHK